MFRVINPFVFGGGIWTPAVNGKMPVAAWVPGRDTAGNGTTTLTDLVGSNDGALTNMDAVTDWVSDDGQYALDFDGSNDRVDFGNVLATIFDSDFSISFWIKTSSTSGQILIDKLGSIGFTSSLNSIGTGRFFLALRDGSGSHEIRTNSDSGVIDGGWHSVVYVFAGGNLSVLVDGVLQAATVLVDTLSGSVANANSLCFGARATIPTTITFSGRSDDTRIWDQALDNTDIAALFAAGRGG